MSADPTLSSNTRHPFSLQEFSDLLSSSFNLPEEHTTRPRRRRTRQPCIQSLASDAATPPRLSLSLSRSLDHLGAPPSPSSSYFDEDSDTEDADPYCSRPSSTQHGDNSFSFGRVLLGHNRAPFNLKSRSSTLAAVRLFKQVRSRASALVLRSSPSTPACSRPHTPPPIDSDSSFIPTLSPFPRSALDLRRAARASSTTPTLRSSVLPFGTRDTNALRPPSPKSFLKLTPCDSRRTITSSHFAPTTHSRRSSYGVPFITPAPTPTPTAVEGLPSFFDDSAYYDDLLPPTPPYARASPPSSPAGSVRSVKIHTRLPPLRKARSYAPGLFTRKSRASRSLASNGLRVSGSELWSSRGEESSEEDIDGSPTSFLFPREAPEPPPCSPFSMPMTGEDDQEVPAYVYERRGSASSAATGMSARSTTSLSERFAKLLPSSRSRRARKNSIPKRKKIPVPLIPPLPRRMASKLSISITPPSSASSDSPRTPNEPAFLPSVGISIGINIAGVKIAGVSDGVTQDEQESEGEDREAKAIEIGRVLTPEEDPFKKGDVRVEKGADLDRQGSGETIVGLGAEGLSPTPTVRGPLAGARGPTTDELSDEKEKRRIKKMFSTWSPFSTPPSSRSSTPSPSRSASPIGVPFAPSSSGHNSSECYEPQCRREGVLERSTSNASFITVSSISSFVSLDEEMHVTPFLKRSVKRVGTTGTQIRGRPGSPFPLMKGISDGSVGPYFEEARCEYEPAVDDSQVLAASPSLVSIPSVIRWKTTGSQSEPSLSSHDSSPSAASTAMSCSPDSVYSQDSPKSSPCDIHTPYDTSFHSGSLEGWHAKERGTWDETEYDEEVERPRTASTLNASPSPTRSSGSACNAEDHTLCEHALLGLSSKFWAEAEAAEEAAKGLELELSDEQEQGSGRERESLWSETGFYSATSRLGSTLSVSSSDSPSSIGPSIAGGSAHI